MDLQKQLDFNLQVDASDLPPLWNTNTLDDKTTTTTTPSVVSSSTLLSVCSMAFGPPENLRFIKKLMSHMKFVSRLVSFNIIL
jgi:hypothetical protein